MLWATCIQQAQQQNAAQEVKTSKKATLVTTVIPKAIASPVGIGCFSTSTIVGFHVSHFNKQYQNTCHFIYKWPFAIGAAAKKDVFFYPTKNHYFSVDLMQLMMLGLHDVQYLYEFLFWLFTFLILRLVWHKPKVRLGYGYFVAALNVFAIAMYTLSSLSGQMSRLDAFAFGFLHAMVSVVMLTLIHKEVNLEKQKES